MADDLLPLVYIVVGYLLALATIYLTVICTRHLAIGKYLIPVRRKRADADDGEQAYRNPYEGYRP